MRALKKLSVLPLAATLTLAACTDSASTAQVTGTVSSQLSDESSPETAEVALLWASEEGDLISSSTTVSGDYPASFSLNLDGPPPAEAILEGAPPAAFGFITALDEGVEVGFSEEIVLYLPEAADGLADYGLETGAIDAGYHLLRLVENEEAFAAVDACYEENIDAVIACEDGCFAGNDPELLGDDAALDGCLEGCFAEDPCAGLVDDAFHVEVLPIDTPIELVMFSDIDEPDFGEIDACLDEAFGEVDGCYQGCVGDVEACEALLDDPAASDEDIDACFNNAFDEGCFEDCDRALDERLEGCDLPDWDAPGDEPPFDDGCFDDAFVQLDNCYRECDETQADEGCYIGCEETLDSNLDSCGPPPGPEPEPLDPEQEACLDEVLPDIDACFEGCDALGFDGPEADIEACWEGCDQLMMDAFNTCGVEYDC